MIQDYEAGPIPRLPPAVEEYPFEFRGTTDEWFRIWVVNTLLCCVTFGIYAPWAMARRKRYFNRNTCVAGRTLDYRARGLQLFMDYPIIIIFVLGYSTFNKTFFADVSLLPALFIIPLILPQVMMSFFAFNARSIIWSNVNFDFEEKEKYSQAFLVYLVYPLLAIVTLFTTYPFVVRARQRLVLNNHRLGTERFRFDAPLLDFYRPFLFPYALVMTIIIFFIVTGHFDLKAWLNPDFFLLWEERWMVAIGGTALFLAIIFYRTAIWSLTANNLQIGDHTYLRSRVDPLRMTFIVLTNTAAIICSAGLLIPWAQIRFARYVTENFSAFSRQHPDAFLGVRKETESAADDLHVDVGRTIWSPLFGIVARIRKFRDVAQGSFLSIEGTAYPPFSSRRRRAVLSIFPDKAVLKDKADNLLLELPRAKLSFASPLGSVSRQARFPDGTLFEMDDHEGMEKLGTGVLLARAERCGGLSIAFVTVGAVIAAFAVWKLVFPAVVWTAVALTPQSFRAALDTEELRFLDTEMRESGLSERDKARARRVFLHLSDQIRDMPEARKGIPGKFRLEFRATPGKETNAYALTGGTIVLTDEIVSEFPGDDVVAGTIAHEMGHVVEDHCLESYYRWPGWYLLALSIFGDANPVIKGIALGGAYLLSLSYSREQERSADLFALRFMREAGYDPRGDLALFESWLDDEEEGMNWLSTHPATRDRIRAVHDFLSKQPDSR